MRLLVTRPEPEAEEMADALRRRGHEMMVAPMLTVVAREEQRIDLSGVQAICFTSRNAVRVFAGLSTERSIPVYAVGPGTAAEARKKAFQAVREGGGNGQSLAETVRAALSPGAGAVLHARGGAVAYDVAGTLRESGFSVREQVLYETLPALALPSTVRHAWASGALDGILFFSPRSAKTFATLIADVGLAGGARRVTAYCLSDAVRNAADLPWHAVRVASRPDVPAMIELLEGDEGAMAEERKTGEGPAQSEPEGSAPEPSKADGQPAEDLQGGEEALDERGHVEAIIGKFGGLRPMASKLDLAVSTVQGWKIRGHIPEQRHEEILKAAKEHDITITAEDLSAPSPVAASMPGERKPEAGSPATEDKAQDETKAKRASPLPTSGAPPAADSKAAEAEAAKEGPGPKPDEQPASDDEIAKPAAAAASAASAAAAAATTAPPPAAVQPRRGSLVPGMLLGAVLCIGGALAAVALRDSWMPIASEEQGPAIDPAMLEQRLDTLASDVAAVMNEVSALSDRASGLETAMASVTAAQDTPPAVSAEDLASLRSAVDSLGQAIDEAKSTAEQDQAEQNASLTAELTALRQALEATGNDVRGELKGLVQQTGSLATAASDNQAAIQSLTSEVSALGVEGLRTETSRLATELASLGDRVGTVESHVSDRQLAERSAMLLGLGRLSDAVASGGAYSQPLGLFGDLAGDRAPADAMAALESHAASGAMPRSALQASFVGAADAMVAAAYEAPPSEGMVRDVIRNLSQLVIVRSRDPESAGVDGAVARAETALNAGDLAGAVAELEGLEGAPAEAAAPWLSDAKARLAVDAAMADLTAALDAMPGAAAN